MLEQLFQVGLMGLKQRIISQIRSAETRCNDKAELEKRLAYTDPADGLQRKAIEEELDFIGKVEKKLALMTDEERNILFEQLDTLTNNEFGKLLKTLHS